MYQMNTYSYVNGMEGAKQYQIMPNQSVLLMDSENPMFYLKTANQMGQSTIRAFRFEEIKPKEERYATEESVAELSKKMDEIMRSLKGDKE